MIFERHFEDGKEDSVESKDDTGSIDAEPYKFLGEDKKENAKSNTDEIPKEKLEKPK